MAIELVPLCTMRLTAKPPIEIEQHGRNPDDL